MFLFLKTVTFHLWLSLQNSKIARIKHFSRQKFREFKGTVVNRVRYSYRKYEKNLHQQINIFKPFLQAKQY